jgi:hypothetical protein
MTISLSLCHLKSEEVHHTPFFKYIFHRCTNLGYNRELGKPKFLKELHKVWNAPELHGLFRSGNTLLIDDSPYKAVRNPPFTAYHPLEWSILHQGLDDAALSETGEIVEVLKGIMVSPNVPDFMKTVTSPPVMTAVPCDAGESTSRTDDEGEGEGEDEGEGEGEEEHFEDRVLSKLRDMNI